MIKQILFTLLCVIPVSAFAQAADPAAGKTKYDMLCASCHSPTGKGDGVAAQSLNPKPRNFSDATIMGKKTDADLKKIIKDGGAATGLSATMPAWGAMLSEQDINNVVAYIRQLGKMGQ